MLTQREFNKLELLKRLVPTASDIINEILMIDASERHEEEKDTLIKLITQLEKETTGNDFVQNFSPFKALIRFRNRTTSI